MADDRVKILTTGRSSVLQIMNAGEDDTGIYTLEISNHLGFNQLSSSVTVEGKRLCDANNKTLSSSAVML